MLPLRSDEVSAFGGTDPDTSTPGPVAVIAASRPVNAGPVGPPANSGDQPAGPPAVSGEAGFGSPIVTAAPTTVAAATGNHKHKLLCFTAFQRGNLLMTCKLPHILMTVCLS